MKKTVLMVHFGLLLTAFSAHAEQPWSLKMVVPMEPGIVCNDIDLMLKFYVGVLGLKVVADANTAPEMSKRFGATPHGYRIVRLQTPYGERIKLVQPNNRPPKPEPVPLWVYERHGFAYLTFVIADMKDVVKRLKEHGVKLVSEEPVEVRKGVFAQYSLDPEGNYVEFVEYPDVPSYRPDLFKWRQFF
ncbi:MAG: VOC family protein [Geobacteraceae bacterium]|nr:VOC family protein [Geobacteraceae bacterium]